MKKYSLFFQNHTQHMHTTFREKIAVFCTRNIFMPELIELSKTVQDNEYKLPRWIKLSFMAIMEQFKAWCVTFISICDYSRSKAEGLYNPIEGQSKVKHRNRTEMIFCNQYTYWQFISISIFSSLVPDAQMRKNHNNVQRYLPRPVHEFGKVHWN